jgi:hypothetical protein
MKASATRNVRFSFLVGKEDVGKEQCLRAGSLPPSNGIEAAIIHCEQTIVPHTNASPLSLHMRGSAFGTR